MRKSGLKAILIDLDNTLIETNQLYDDAIGSLAAYINGFVTADPIEIDQYLRQRLMEMIKTHGFSTYVLPKGFEETLLHYIDGATPQHVEEVRAMAEAVFVRTAAVRAGAEDALKALSVHFDLYLVTAGDLDVQRRRVESLPFKSLFVEVFIVLDKNSDVYRDVLEKIGCVPHETVMIGDSLRSDIIPSTEIGMRAIYIESENFKELEVHGKTFPRGAQQHTHLEEAAQSLIRTHKTRARTPKRRTAGPS